MGMVGVDAGAPAQSARGGRTAALLRTVATVTVIAVIAIGACATATYRLARHNDELNNEQRRAALRASVNEIRSMVTAGGEVDPRILRVIEQSSGVAGLKFQAEPAEDGRESQPVLDGNGRIAGFLTWQSITPLTAAARFVTPVFGGLAGALLVFGAIAIWRFRRGGKAGDDDDSDANAKHGPLSQSPNAMMKSLEDILARREIRQTVVFALIEFDDLGEIHNQFGAAGVGQAIAAIVGRLKEILPEGSLVGRRASDRLLVVMSGVTDAMDIMQEAMKAIVQPHWVDGVIRIGAHVGFAQAPRDAVAAEELLRATHQALRAAAKKGSGTVVAYDRALSAMTEEQQFIRRELPRALAANELELHYQPIVTADGGIVTGVEALLRWSHATRGNISPSVFVPVAEQMGLIGPLGEFVLRRALLDAARWPSLYIGVNLSPMQVRDGSIVDIVRDTLTQTRMEPSRLMLEITEGVLIENPDEMVRRIHDLRELGVKIALDDFGSGYSNLSYLQRFPIDKLKIDRAFVGALGQTANAGVIVQAIIALGRALGLKVLVEGVETDEQRILLRMAGCDEMQGFLFARPAPAKAIDRMMAQLQTGRLAPQQQPQSATQVLTASA